MLLTNREEELLKAFKKYGKLSVDDISHILKVSKRTVYRVLTGLGDSLEQVNVTITKEQNKYFLTGELVKLEPLTVQEQEHYTRSQRLTFITYQLLISTEERTNDYFQKELSVSNVTIIQDIQDIELRLADFDIVLQRKKGYQIQADGDIKRRFLANLLTNSLSFKQFIQGDYGKFTILSHSPTSQAISIFQEHQQDLLGIDTKIAQFLMTLLALSHFEKANTQAKRVSKIALEFTQKVYKELSLATQNLYTLADIVYFAEVLDDVLISKQETPLYNENFDSNFFYNVSNFIDKVSAYTKINFVKDRVLFKFLFYHIRSSLAVPTIFEDTSNTIVDQSLVNQNDYLRQVVCLLIQDIFPKYLRRATEYEFITLHFAASLRRSPDIYPIRLLLITDERPLATELLVTRLKAVAPFVESITIKSSTEYLKEDKAAYDAILATKLISDEKVKTIPLYPDAKEVIALQEFLQDIQLNREIKPVVATVEVNKHDFQKYLLASQMLLERFSYYKIQNQEGFDETVLQLVKSIPMVSDSESLSQKLIRRFEISPMAIPETHLALLHTHSKTIKESRFMVFDLERPIPALSMNHEKEIVSRILVMLTPRNEGQEIKDLMTAISQSIIENRLYTEIYKTGNQEIIYHLLNQIFTDRIKKLED